MQMMSNGLEAAAGNRMKRILEKLTANRFFRGCGWCRNYSGYPVFICYNSYGCWICSEAFDLVCAKERITVDRLSEIAATEQKIDDMTEAFRKNQIDRMKVKPCSDEACILYSEMLTDFERIGDHILNIGQALAGRIKQD